MKTVGHASLCPTYILINSLVWGGIGERANRITSQLMRFLRHHILRTFVKVNLVDGEGYGDQLLRNELRQLEMTQIEENSDLARLGSIESSLNRIERMI